MSEINSPSGPEDYYDKAAYLEKYKDTPLLSLEEIFADWVPLYNEWRNEYIDDLPDHIVAPEDNDPNYDRYKCRTRWFGNIKNSLPFFIPHISDEQLTQKLVGYILYLDNSVDWSKRRTKEDIDQGNEILDIVINYFDELFNNLHKY